MARRDQLTYDLGPAGRPSVPWKPALLLAVVIALAGLLVVWAVTSRRAPEATPVSVPTSASPVPSAVTPSTSTSPLPSGSDADEGQGLPVGSQQAASAFVRAWLDPKPETRGPALRKVASPALTEQLMLTDPANIPRARPRGAPVLEDASTFSTQFTQGLSSGTRISVYLVADPGARYGWLATSVNQA